MEYKIIQNSNEDNLEKEVNKYLKEGWKLSGGLAIYRHMVGGYSFGITFYQAIYKD